MILRTPGTTTAARVRDLVAAHRFQDAYDLLRTKGADDGECLFTLAMWRLGGQIVGRDLAASRDLFRQASELGHDEAEQIYLNFVANGTGGEADWPLALDLLAIRARESEAARTELNLIGNMNLSPDGAPIETPEGEIISNRPYVSVFRGLFSTAECRFLVDRAAPRLAPSLIIDPRTGQQVQNPIRTSESMAFPFVQETPAVHALNRRIAGITQTDARCGEPLQVLRYHPGQQYRAHFDSEAGAENQRILTVLVYLNDEYEGGETLFVHNGLRFKGRLGDAIAFRNALPDGRPDELSQHAGLPVTAGAKIIASRWIRQKFFLLQPPAPLLDV